MLDVVRSLKIGLSSQPPSSTIRTPRPASESLRELVLTGFRGRVEGRGAGRTENVGGKSLREQWVVLEKVMVIMSSDESVNVLIGAFIIKGEMKRRMSMDIIWPVAGLTKTASNPFVGRVD